MSVINRNKNKKKGRISSRENVHSAENIKHVKFLLKLKQQETLMEKNLSNLMGKMTLESEVSQLLLHNMNDTSRKRQFLLNSVKKSLDGMAEEMRSAKSVMNYPENIQELDTNAYRERLMRLLQKFQDFRKFCQLESLSQEQTSLESELHEFELNLHKYENATGSIGKQTSVVSSDKGTKRYQDYKDIQDFHALIVKTGHTNNWTEKDHLLFLKTRKECNNIPALVAVLQIKCPDLTAETIVNHEAWYKMYLKLREKQRSNVKEWRMQKEQNKIKKKLDEETKNEDSIEISPEKTNLNITEKYSICIADKSKMKIMKTGEIIDVNAMRKKELIKRWKIERENKRSMDEQQSKIQMESRLAFEEKRKKERLKRIQEALAEYHRKKSMEVSYEALKNNSREAQKCDPTLIRIFRKQDEDYARKRKTLILSAKSSSKKQTMKILKPQMTKTRDYSTLFNPTKVWKEKCRIKDIETKEPKQLQYIKDIPRLYIRWRNKESSEIV